MGFVATIIIFIAVLSLLVFVHEFGHFIVAKKSGVQVDEFGFGFPPRIIGKKFKGTLYSINWIPLGGFVKIKGVAGDDKEVEKNQESHDSFATKPFPFKFLILFAGILMNLLLGAVLFIIVYAVGVQSDPAELESGAITSDQQVYITGILPDSPAEGSDIEAGDIILQVDSTAIITADDLRIATSQNIGEQLDITIERNNDQHQITVAPESLELEGEQYTGIGVGVQEIVTARYPWYQAIWIGIKTTGLTIALIFTSLYEMGANFFSSGSVGEDVAGPVGIAVLTGKVAQLGIVPLMQFTALLSINLGIFNLLPIPALDGGRLVFVIAEGIRKKPINQNLEAIVHNIGFALLLLMVLLVTFKDISQYNLLGFLGSIF